MLLQALIWPLEKLLFELKKLEVFQGKNITINLDPAASFFCELLIFTAAGMVPVPEWPSAIEKRKLSVN